MISAALLIVSVAAAQEKVTYDEHVRPIFQQRCGKCHNAERKRADFDALTFQGVMAGASTGEVVQPGQPDDSRLYLLVAHLEEPVMPPGNSRIPDAELATIKAWIAGGLLENSGSKARKPKKRGVSLALSAPATGKPEGPPPMPGDVLLDPVLVTERPGTITALAHSPWAPLVALGGQKQVVLYNSATLELCGILPFPEGDPKSLKFSGNGRFLLVGGGKDASLGVAALFDVTTGRRVTRVGKDADAVLSSDITSDQSLIATGGPDRLVKVFSIATGDEAYRIKKHTDWVTSVAFSPDSVLLASGDRGGNLHVWEARDGGRFYDLRGHRGAITALCFRTDSNVLASASADGTVKLWDMHTGRQIRSFTAHGGGVEDVRYSMTGSIVTAGRDRRVKTWDGNGRATRQFDPFDESALAATYDHESKRVVGTDWKGTVRAWDAAKGDHLGDLAANPPSLARRIDDLSQAVSGPAIPSSVTALQQATAASAKAADTELKALRARKAEADAAVKSHQANIAELTRRLDESRKAVKTANGSIPKLEARIPTLESALNTRRARGAEAETASKLAEQRVTERAALVTAQKKAAETARALSDRSGNDADLKRAAELAAQAVQAMEVAEANARKAQAEALTVRDRLRAEVKADQAALEKRKAELAAARKTLQRGAAIESECVPKREAATAALATAELKAEALTAPLAAMEKVTATILTQAKDAEKLAQEIGQIAARLTRLRAARVFTDLYYAREELTAATLLAERRAEDLKDARATRLSAENQLLAAEAALDETNGTLALAHQSIKKADTDIATAKQDEALRTRELDAARKATERLEAAVDAATEAHTGYQAPLAERQRAATATTSARIAAEQKVAEAEASLGKASRALDLFTAQELRLRESIRELDASSRAINTELQQQGTVHDNRAEVTRLEATLRSFTDQSTELRARLTASESRHGSLIAARDVSDSRLRDQRVARDNAATRLQQLRDQAAELRDRRLRLLDTARELGGKISQQGDDPAALTELRRDLGKVAGEALEQTWEQVRAGRRTRTQAATVAALSRVLDASASDRDATVADADAAASEVENLRESIVKVTSEQERISGKIQAMKRAATASPERLAADKARRTTLLQRLQALEVRRTELRARTTELRAQRKPLTDAVHTNQDRLRAHRQEVAARSAVEKTALTEAAAAAAELRRLSAAVETAKRARDEGIAKAATAASALETSRESVARSVANREAAAAGLTAAQASLQAATDMVRQRGEAARNSRQAVRSAEGLLEDAATQRRTIQQRVSALETAYKQAQENN